MPGSDAGTGGTAEVLRGLGDSGNGHTRRCRVVKRGGRGASGETLQLEVAARVKDVEWFSGHARLALGLWPANVLT